MKRIKLLGLCCMAVFVVGAVASATASAGPPEFLQCARTAGVTEGNYGDAACTKKIKQSKYVRTHMPVDGIELASHLACQKIVEPKTGFYKDKICSEPGAAHECCEFIRTKFDRHLAESIGVGVTLETKAGTKVSCKEEKQKNGKFSGDKTVEKFTMVFIGCKSGEFECKTKEAKEGEIKTNELKGEIGNLEKANKKVGLKLVSAKEKGTFLEFECASGFTKVIVTGASYGEIKFTKFSETNEFSKTGELIYAEEKGKPKWSKFEGEAEAKLETSINGGKAEESGIAVSAKIASTAEEGAEEEKGEGGDAIAIEGT